MVKALFGGLFSSTLGLVFVISGTLGWAYWMWMAIKLGSFLMFFLGILGPFAIFAGIIGLWSFIFGAPIWLLSLVTS